MAAKITPTNKPTATVTPILWEITMEDAHGHRSVTRVYAATEDEALDLLPVEAPDVVEVRRP